MFYDAHIHRKNKENGGFIVGLEGEPYFENTYNNMQVLSLHEPNNHYISFYYVSKLDCNNKINHKYLKYHPRREKYTREEVINSIEMNEPNAVMLDTLNEPYWQAYDYWKIARKFRDTIFIFAHSGGYLINEFVKICHFQPNVWLDYSLTHTVLGHLGDKLYGMACVNDAIKYSLNSSFKDRILLSSDYPFFCQEEVVYYYKDYIEQLNDNFENLVKIIIKEEK